ncbi:MAG: PaaI family thioesterase [Thermoleophilaceae bacterium]|nr:PaaI family thioesterase [Thermoleophilaceae bacterium]
MNETYDEIVAAVLELPLHKAVGIGLIDANDPARGIVVEVDDRNVNPLGNLHGGIVPLLLDIASYLAAAELFEPGTNAVTASNSISLLRPVQAGEKVKVTAEVDRLGRNAFFLTARATCNDQLVATGQIVKAVILDEATIEAVDAVVARAAEAS